MLTQLHTRIYSYLLIALLCFSFTACGASYALSRREKPTVIKLNLYGQAQIVDIGMKEKKEYVVKETIDLCGNQVNVPEGVVITFKKGGTIVNGTLHGNGTKINSKIDEVLGVKLKGSWIVDKVSDFLFSKEYLTDTEIINNINTIQSDDINNEIIINRDYNIIIGRSGGAGLLPSSHSIIFLKGTLSLEGNNYKSYQIIDIKNKTDVSIIGGRIVGDVGKHTYIENSSSEWGMGVNVNESRNVSLSDLFITKCTGDGIYISGGNEPSVGFFDRASCNVVIRNVTCEANRRQGLSIIHVDGLIVEDCKFLNTGEIEFTGPGSGIDIEPNVRNGWNMSARNIFINNCEVTGNRGNAVSTSCSVEMNGLVNHQSIVIENCHTDGPLKAQSAGLIVRNCSFSQVRFSSLYIPTHIVLEDCIIEGGNGIVLYAPSSQADNPKDRLLSITLKGCYISLSEDNLDTDALFTCYKSYVPNLGSVHLEKCYISVPNIKDKPLSFTSYSMMGKMHVLNSRIEMRGREFNAQGLILRGNDIYCKSLKGVTDKGINRVSIEK